MFDKEKIISALSTKIFIFDWNLRYKCQWNRNGHIKCSYRFCSFVDWSWVLRPVQTQTPKRKFWLITEDDLRGRCESSKLRNQPPSLFHRPGLVGQVTLLCWERLFVHKSRLIYSFFWGRSRKMIPAAMETILLLDFIKKDHKTGVSRHVTLGTWTHFNHVFCKALCFRRLFVVMVLSK